MLMHVQKVVVQMLEKDNRGRGGQNSVMIDYIISEQSFIKTPGKIIKSPGKLLENSWIFFLKIEWPPCIYIHANVDIK